MKKLRKLSEHLQEKIPGVDLNIAKEIIREYENFKHKIRGTFCDVCHVPLTPEEMQDVSRDAFHCCCAKHKKYQNDYNLVQIRKEENITDDDLFDFFEL